MNILLELISHYDLYISCFVSPIILQKKILILYIIIIIYFLTFYVNFLYEKQNVIAVINIVV